MARQISNKKLGTGFEQEVVDLLAANGYWAHFITPDVTGAQPFDIIASKDGKPLALDCKTCVENTFRLGRLEQNQIMAFEKWLACGNPMPQVWVKHFGYIYIIDYVDIRDKKRIKLDENQTRIEIDKED